MTTSYVLMQNLRRNPLRTALTAVAFALPMAIFVLAISFVVSFAQVAAAAQQELRLAVTHKVSLTNMLPDGMRRKIEELDRDRPADAKRIRTVCGMRWFGGRVPGTQNTLQSLGADKDTFPAAYSDIGLTAEEIDWWNREKRAAVAGAGAARQYGWKVGQRVELESTIPPYTRLEFVIIRIMGENQSPSAFYFRRDYLVDSYNEMRIPGEGCNIFWVKCASAAALQELQQEVDRLFANSPDETKSQDENAFLATFLQAIGDLPGLARVLAIVVVCIIALVAGNTMTMSFRERIRELAVFKAIGFQSGRVFLIVLSESVLLALVGSLAGIVPVSAALVLIPRQYLTYGAFSPPALSVIAVAGSLAIGLLVGLLSGAWPAYQALRLRTVDALRRVA